jgi:hypothetical protein
MNQDIKLPVVTILPVNTTPVIPAFEIICKNIDDTCKKAILDYKNGNITRNDAVKIINSNVPRDNYKLIINGIYISITDYLGTMADALANIES